MILLGFLPTGNAFDSDKSLLIRHSSLISQTIYEDWCKYISDRVQRDSIPKMVPSTVDKFLGINYDMTKKEYLIEHVFGTKDKKLMKKSIVSLIDEIHRVQNCQRA